MFTFVFIEVQLIVFMKPTDLLLSNVAYHMGLVRPLIVIKTHIKSLIKTVKIQHLYIFSYFINEVRRYITSIVLFTV